MTNLFRTIVRGFGWRLGALAAIAAFALAKKFL